MVDLKVVGKVVVKGLAVAAGAIVGAELGFAGGAAAMNDGIAISKKFQPKPVKVKGWGPFKKVVLETKNPFTGEVVQTTVRVKKQPVKKQYNF